MSCPRQHFITNLVRFIVGLKEGNNKIILAVGINEHIENSKLTRELKKNGLANVRVKNLISQDQYPTLVEVIQQMEYRSRTSAILILPHKFGAGDHRIVLADFDLDKIVEKRVRICRQQMRRLECKNSQSHIAMHWYGNFCYAITFQVVLKNQNIQQITQRKRDGTLSLT